MTNTSCGDLYLAPNNDNIWDTTTMLTTSVRAGNEGVNNMVSWSHRWEHRPQVCGVVLYQLWH